MVGKKGGVKTQECFAHNPFFVQVLKYTFCTVDQFWVEYLIRDGRDSHGV
jgi:hypothetical protein